MQEQLENWWQAKSTWVSIANVSGGVILIVAHVALMLGGFTEIVAKLDSSLLGIGTGVALISLGGALFASRGTQERIIKQNDAMLDQGKRAEREREEVAEDLEVGDAERSAESVASKSKRK